MVRRGRREDIIVIVIINTYIMDILSDLAARLAGSIGVAPSSNLSYAKEPVAVCTFDMTGRAVQI